jgi:alpha-1,2-mannosyltransferase
VDKRIGADGTAVLRRPLNATAVVSGRRGPAGHLVSAPSRTGLADAAERLALGLLPPLLVLVLIAARYAIGKHLGFDYRPLWEASRHVFEGASPYPASTAALHNEQQFVYPPLAALLAAPFAVFPFGVAAALLAAFELAATVLTLRVLRVRDWRCYGVVFLWYPVIQNLLIGSITSLLALGLAIAWRYRDDARAATPVAAAVAATKVFLWPLLFWLAVTRMRVAVRAAALAVAGVAISWAVIGFAGLTSYPHLLDRVSALEQSKSYSAVALGIALGLPAGPARILAVAVGTVVLFSVLMVARRGGADADRRAFVLAIAAAFLFSPIVWTHYLALLVVPVAITRRTLSPLWFVPLLMWLTPGQSDGHAWRVIVGVSVWVVVLAATFWPGWRLVAFGRRPEPVPTP